MNRRREEYLCRTSSGLCSPESSNRMRWCSSEEHIKQNAVTLFQGNFRSERNLSVFWSGDEKDIDSFVRRKRRI